MKTLSLFTATMALLLASFASQATTINANYSIDLNSTDPGLVVNSADVANNPFAWNLSEGESTTFDLFEIWTDEGTVNWCDRDGWPCDPGDDVISKSISADFSFILPTVPDGSVDGATTGNIYWCYLIADCQYGSVKWSGPTDFYFGDGGQFRISLSDETFNWGVYGLNSGETYGATVQATITLLKDSTAVPGPGGLAIFGFGLLSLGFFLRRKRQS